ncbi:unnamed protein product [Phytophthora fragariaefolia]|uniref:Glutathione peroxidase n=1 Tax=Phytophthora fragariaefolia TaxID=1490495 RepID=A0A9W7CUI5_9STRA|nr:unnamed protein product [Phytophthora fragariaefolia]
MASTQHSRRQSKRVTAFLCRVKPPNLIIPWPLHNQPPIPQFASPCARRRNPSLSPSAMSSEGVIQAGNLFRKRCGLLAKLTGGKQLVHVEANDKKKNVTLFESEANKASPLAVVDLSADATVEFDASMTHGIKLANPKISEVFAAESKEKQEEWLNSFINAGAQYREVFNVADTAKIKSFYELKDFDMAGNEVSMAKYKGKVVLAVNVSSKCGLTPTNYPELQELYAKYKDQGLEVLAFPCNQFAGQEPGTHEEIMEFVKQYNVTFPFFEKHDVNGATARPVFTYLKTKLPGSFGDFVKWNFTKFLVDRNGQPFKRFAPKDRPLSFEEDIKTLLAQKATEE